jgi:hypothetical protein
MERSLGDVSLGPERGFRLGTLAGAAAGLGGALVLAHLGWDAGAPLAVAALAGGAYGAAGGALVGSFADLDDAVRRGHPAPAAPAPRSARPRRLAAGTRRA